MLKHTVVDVVRKMLGDSRLKIKSTKINEKIFFDELQDIAVVHRGYSKYEAWETIAKLIECLTLEERILLKQYYYDEESLKAIVQGYNLSESMMSFKIKLIRQKLAQML